MPTTEVRVVNRLGLHARAAAKVVSVASRYQASIRIGPEEDDLRDARSIMALLTLGAGQGSRLQVEAEGEEAEAALEELRTLFDRGFDEYEEET